MASFFSQIPNTYGLQESLALFIPSVAQLCGKQKHLFNLVLCPKKLFSDIVLIVQYVH